MRRGEGSSIGGEPTTVGVQIATGVPAETTQMVQRQTAPGQIRSETTGTVVKAPGHPTAEPTMAVATRPSQIGRVTIEPGTGGPVSRDINPFPGITAEPAAGEPFPTTPEATTEQAAGHDPADIFVFFADNGGPTDESSPADAGKGGQPPAEDRQVAPGEGTVVYTNGGEHNQEDHASGTNDSGRNGPPETPYVEGTADDDDRRREVAQSIRDAARDSIPKNSGESKISQVQSILKNVADSMPEGTPFPTRRTITDIFADEGIRSGSIGKALKRLHVDGTLIYREDAGTFTTTAEEKVAAQERMAETARLQEEASRREPLNVTFVEDERLDQLAQNLISGTPDFPSLIQTFLERQTTRQRRRGIEPLSFPGYIFELYCSQRLAELVQADSSLSFSDDRDIPPGHRTATFRFDRTGGITKNIQAKPIRRHTKGGTDYDGLVLLNRSEEGLSPVPVVIEYKMSGATNDKRGSVGKYQGYVTKIIQAPEINKKFAPIMELYGTTEVGYIIITTPHKIKPNSPIQTEFAANHGILEATSFTFNEYIAQLKEAIIAVAAQDTEQIPNLDELTEVLDTLVAKKGSKNGAEQAAAQASAQDQPQEDQEPAERDGSDRQGPPPPEHPGVDAEDGDDGEIDVAQRIRTALANRPQLDRSEEAPEPLDKQVSNVLTDVIRDLPLGKILPPEEVLKQIFEIEEQDEQTIQKAMANLHADHLVFTLEDKGIFTIRQEPDRTMEHVTYIESALRAGIVFGTLEQDYQLPTSAQLASMGLHDDEVRHILTSLQEGGLVVSRPRLGTRVTEGPHPIEALTPREMQREQPVVVRRIPPGEKIATLTEKRVNVTRTIIRTHASEALNREDPATLPEQVATIMQGIIADLPLGNPIPDTRDWRGLFAIDEQTAQEAMDILHAKKLVYTLPGVQTYTIRQEPDSDMPPLDHHERAFRVGIAAGVLPNGYQLSISKHLEAMGLAPVEIPQLLKSLQKDELVVSRRGVGTFVTEHRVPYAGQVSNHVNELITSVALRPKQPIPSSADLAQRFDASTGDIEYALRKLQIDGILKTSGSGDIVLAMSDRRWVEMIVRERAKNKQPGEPVSSLLQLAAELDVDPGTVGYVYGKLREEGVLTTEKGSATRVAGGVDPLKATVYERLQGLDPNDPAPSVRKLAEELDVDPRKINRFYKEAAADGWIATGDVPQHGYFRTHQALVEEPTSDPDDAL